MYTKKPFEHQHVTAEDPYNRRTVQRRHLIYYLRVWNMSEDPPQVLGHVVDITTEGLMLISEQAIPLDQSFELEIRWQDPDNGDQAVRFRARSLWGSRDVNPSFHDTGFHLEEDDPDILAPIQELIGRFGFHD